MNTEGRCGDATEHDRDGKQHLALPMCQLARVGGHGNPRPSEICFFFNCPVLPALGNKLPRQFVFFFNPIKFLAFLQPSSTYS